MDCCAIWSDEVDVEGTRGGKRKILMADRNNFLSEGIINRDLSDLTSSIRVAVSVATWNTDTIG